MLLISLLLTPILGIFAIFINKDNKVSLKNIKLIALTASVINLFISLVTFILFDFSTNQFQFVQEYHEISYYDFYLGVDGLSIYFILLTTLIIPISLVSNWNSIKKDIESYVIIILLLETLLLAVFLMLDILLFYIFFESILPPLFILIGIFGSDNRVKASFYLFLYTLLGSLFLLLSILAMSSIMSTTDFDTLFKGNFFYLTQLFLFYGIFIAFAVKTPTIFLNTWLLKAHVESPLGGSIILAAIVLKLSLYGILRLILPILPKAYMVYTYIIFLIGVITIIYASLSTLRTIDIKELIAYSSVSHAAVYLLGVFSNCIQGIEGAINLGLAHGLVSPGLFICAGGVLYDRSSTRVISFYRGVTQVMPLFSILFFLLCLANCGAPLTLNFIGEFLSLYGVFERSSLFGVFASSSIIFSAAYTIYMYQRISFGGVYSSMFIFNIPDLTKREFTVLGVLVVPTVLFGIYPAPILDGLHYSVTTLIYSFDLNIISCDSVNSWVFYFKDNVNIQVEKSALDDNIIYCLASILFILVLIEKFMFKNSYNYNRVNPHGYEGLLLKSGCDYCCSRCSTFLGNSFSTFCDWCGCLTKHHDLYKAGFHKNKETAHLFDANGPKPSIPSFFPCPVCARGTPTKPEDNSGSSSGGNGGSSLGGDNSSSVDTSTNNYFPVFTLSFVLDLPLLEAIVGSILLMVDSSLAYLLVIFQPFLYIYRLYKLPSRLVKFYSLVVGLWEFLQNSSRIPRIWVIYVIFGIFSVLFLSMFSMEFGCDSPKSWEIYFDKSFYHNGFVSIFWVAVLAISVKFWSFIKDFFCCRTKRISLLLLANLSLSTLVLIVYFIYFLTISFFTLQQALVDEFSSIFVSRDYCMIEEEPNTLSTNAIQTWREHIFMASKGDKDLENTGGEIPLPTNSSGNTTPEPNESEKNWTPIPGGMRWVDEWGNLRVAYYIDPEGKPTLFRPNWQAYIKPLSPPRTWGTVGGQGANPVYFTTALHGETLNRENTTNASSGIIDYCEAKRTDHRWNTVDVWNLKQDNGVCFQCKTTTSFRHYACDNCYRHICHQCDVKSNFTATMNFNNRLNGR